MSLEEERLFGALAFVAVLIATGVGLFFVHENWRRIWNSRGFRRLAASAVAWTFLVLLWSLMKGEDWEYDQGRLILILVLPPIGAWLLPYLWAWVRKSS